MTTRKQYGAYIDEKYHKLINLVRGRLLASEAKDYSKGAVGRALLAEVFETMTLERIVAIVKRRENENNKGRSKCSRYCERND